jgi:hypothetical protein
MTLAQSDSTYVNSCLSSNAFRPVTIHAFLCFFITKLCVTKTQVSNVVLVDDSLGLLTLKGANLCVLRLCESGCTTFSCYTCTRWRMQVDVKSEVNVSATKGKDSLIPLNKIIPSSPLKEGIDDEEEAKRRNSSTSYEVTSSKLLCLDLSLCTLEH